MLELIGLLFRFLQFQADKGKVLGQLFMQDLAYMTPFPFFCQHNFFLQLFLGGSFSFLPLFFFGDIA
jgi:hypothetical protein